MKKQMNILAVTTVCLAISLSTTVALAEKPLSYGASRAEKVESLRKLFVDDRFTDSTSPEVPEPQTWSKGSWPKGSFAERFPRLHHGRSDISYDTYRIIHKYFSMPNRPRIDLAYHLDEVNFQINDGQLVVLNALIEAHNSPDKEPLDTLDIKWSSSYLSYVFPYESSPELQLRSHTTNLMAKIILGTKDNNGFDEGRVLEALGRANLNAEDTAKIEAKIAALSASGNKGFTGIIEEEIDRLNIEGVRDGSKARDRIADSLQRIRITNKGVKGNREDIYPGQTAKLIRLKGSTPEKDAAVLRFLKTSRTDYGQNNGFREQYAINELFGEEPWYYWGYEDNGISGNGNAAGFALANQLMRNPKFKDPTYVKPKRFLTGVDQLISDLIANPINSVQKAAIEKIMRDVARDLKKADSNKFFDFAVASQIAKAKHFDQAKWKLAKELMYHWKSGPHSETSSALLAITQLDRPLTDEEYAKIYKLIHNENHVELAVYASALLVANQGEEALGRQYRDLDEEKTLELAAQFNPDFKRKPKNSLMDYDRSWQYKQVKPEHVHNIAAP